MDNKLKGGWIVGTDAFESLVVLHTVDGVTWTKQEACLGNFTVGGITAIDENNAVITGGQSLAGKQYAVTLVTNDSGVTWNILKGDEGSEFFASIASIDDELWAGGAGGTVFKSESYKNIDWIPTTTSNQIPAGIQIQGIACPSHKVIYAAGNGTGALAPNGGGLWKSINGGGRWDQFSNIPNPKKHPTGFIGVWAFNEDEVIAYGCCALCVKTMNGGGKWESLMELGVTMFPDNNGFWATDEKHFWMARDQGHLQYRVAGMKPKAWKEYQIEQIGEFFLLDVCVIGSRIWVVGVDAVARTPGNGIYLYSPDGGVTWERPFPVATASFQKICLVAG